MTLAADRERTRYAANRDEINSRRRQRYAQDAEYRDRKLAANRSFRAHPEFDRSRYRRSEKSTELRRKYGITLDMYEFLMLQQEGRCAACSAAAESEWALHVDHCHHSGLVRGLLCFPCNASLGQAGDSADRLMSLVTYLLQAQEGTK